jgi:hypothetical protein
MSSAHWGVKGRLLTKGHSHHHADAVWLPRETVRVQFNVWALASLSNAALAALVTGRPYQPVTSAAFDRLAIT